MTVFLQVIIQAFILTLWCQNLMPGGATKTKLNESCIRKASKCHHFYLKQGVLSITLHKGYTRCYVPKG